MEKRFIQYIQKNLFHERHGGENMSGMTKEQFDFAIKAIIQILKDDGVKDETIKKIEALLEK